MSDKIDKIYDLVEKVYIELQDTKKDLGGRISNLDTRVSNLESEVKKNSNHIVRMENEMSNKFGILFDFQKSTDEHFNNIEDKLESISSKVDKHDIKIQVIEGGKKKKAK
jgi:cell division septum initiation protein DivIVA